MPDAYLTRHSNGRLTTNVYDKGSRLHQGIAPPNIDGRDNVFAWADNNLREFGWTRTGQWAQPEGFDKDLHDYKASVVPSPDMDPESRSNMAQINRTMAPQAQRQLAIHR